MASLSYVDSRVVVIMFLLTVFTLRIFIFLIGDKFTITTETGEVVLEGKILSSCGRVLS